MAVRVTQAEFNEIMGRTKKKESGKKNTRKNIRKTKKGKKGKDVYNAKEHAAQLALDPTSQVTKEAGAMKLDYKQSKYERAFVKYVDLFAPALSELYVTEICLVPGFRYRTDFLFVVPTANGPKRLAIEVDGGQYKTGGGSHGGPSDTFKDFMVLAQGVPTVRVKGAAINKDAKRVINLLVNSLVAIGWEPPKENKYESNGSNED